LLKKILSFLGKSDSEPEIPTMVTKNDHAKKDNEELLNRIIMLEEKQLELLKNQSQPQHEEEYTLTNKQIEFALSILEKMREYELAIEPAKLTVKDLNRLVAYNRYNNKGAIVNLEKKGILKKKSKVNF
jgi:DNA-binding MarR family transcriptional regulator